MKGCHLDVVEAARLEGMATTRPRLLSRLIVCSQTMHVHIQPSEPTSGWLSWQPTWIEISAHAPP